MILRSLSYYPQAMDLLFHRTRPDVSCGDPEKRTSVSLAPGDPFLGAGRDKVASLQVIPLAGEL